MLIILIVVVPRVLGLNQDPGVTGAVQKRMAPENQRSRTMLGSQRHVTNKGSGAIRSSKTQKEKEEEEEWKSLQGNT